MREDGPVLANERRPELAMAAHPDCALHVPLHRVVDVASDTRRWRASSTVNRIRISGPHVSRRYGSGSIWSRLKSKFGTTPTRPFQASIGAINGDMISIP